MIIKTIHIMGYRSFEDSGELNLTKLFALIGKNNSGKSAFIDSIQVLWALKQVSDEDFHKGKSQKIHIKAIITDYGRVGSADKATKRKEKEHQGKDTTVEYKHSKGEKGKYYIDKNEVPATKLKKALPELLIIPAIRNPKNESTAGTKSYMKELINAVLNLKESSSIDYVELKKMPSEKLKISDVRALLEIKSRELIASVAEGATNHLQEDLGDESLELDVDPESDLSKAVGFVTKIKDPNLGAQLQKVDVLSCGTGLQSMVILALLQVYADVKESTESILLVEEPEVYLHPDFQRKMFYALRKIAKKTQVVYTTHSPIMISELWANDSVRLVKREDGKTIICPIDVMGVVSELGIRYDDVLNPSAVIFVEGKTDVSVYTRITALLFPDLKENLERRIKYIQTEGYRNIHAYALMSILMSNNVNAEYFLIVDGDGMGGEERKNEVHSLVREKLDSSEKVKTQNLKERIFPLKRYSVESYFLDYEFIKRIGCQISKPDFDYFIAHYEKKYNSAIEQYRKKKSVQSLEEFGKKFKAKFLFENPRRQNQMRGLEKAFDDDPKFLKVRKEIISAWKKIISSGKDPVELIINQDTIKLPILKELIDNVRKVIDKSEHKRSS